MALEHDLVGQLGLVVPFLLGGLGKAPDTWLAARSGREPPPRFPQGPGQPRQMPMWGSKILQKLQRSAPVDQEIWGKKPMMFDVHMHVARADAPRSSI